MKKLSIFKSNYILIFISLMSLTFNMNSYINYLFHLIILILVLKCNFRISIAIYTFVSIWVLVFYQGEHQVFIFMIDIIIFIKAFLFVIRENLKFRARDYLFFIILSFYVLLSILLYGDISVVRPLLSAIILFTVRMYFVKTKDELIIRELLKYFSTSVIISVLYGYFHQSFAVDRFVGIHSPNYMGLYLNLSLVIVLLTDIVREKYKYIIVIYLFVALLLTKSTSALVISTFILFLFIITSVYKHRDKINMKITFAIPILIALIITVTYIFNMNIQIGAIERVLNRSDLGNSFDINMITNQRATLWEIYFNKYLEFGTLKNLFGSAVFSPMEYTNLSAGSHNTYIDILWFVGAFGLLVLLYILYLNILDYKSSKYFKSLLFIKLVFLINMFSMSLLSSRFFYILLLL